MKDVIITLTDTQYNALSYAAASVEDWVENAALSRAKTATDEIVQITVQHCLANGIAIPSTVESIVSYAFANNIVKTAEQRNQEVATVGLSE